MQKNKIQDYDSFRNEITILMQLVIVFRSYSSARTTQILSSCTKLGKLNESASLSLSKYLNAHEIRDQSFLDSARVENFFSISRRASI